MMKQLSIKLPFEIFRGLQQEATRKHLSISDVIREKILTYKVPHSDSS